MKAQPQNSLLYLDWSPLSKASLLQNMPIHSLTPVLCISFPLYLHKISAQPLRTWPSTHQHCTTANEIYGAMEEEAAEHQNIRQRQCGKIFFYFKRVLSPWVNFKLRNGSPILGALKFSWLETGTKLISCKFTLAICAAHFFNYAVVSLPCTWHYSALR